MDHALLEPTLEDLLAAFEDIREPNPYGASCRPADADAVIRMVINRSKELGGSIRQLVRLVRVAALCSDKTYVEFFSGIRTFRSFDFKAAIVRATAERRISPTQLYVEGSGVVLAEPPMRTSAKGGEAFDISFGQMPRLVLLHHVLWRFLHYPRLYNSEAAARPQALDEEKGLFWPLAGETVKLDADTVASNVQSCLNRHLSHVLASSSTAARQVQVIGGYLDTATKQAHPQVQADAIDDDLLFAFWEAQVLADQEGFKLYRSAVTKMLRFRRALRLALAEFQPVLRLDSGEDAGNIDLDRLQPASLDAGTWQSPMIALTPLCKMVKFLNARERACLANYLPGCECGDEEPDEEDAGATEDVGRAASFSFRLSLIQQYAQGAGGALMGMDRFDLRLLRTLLRADVFHTAQHSLGPEKSGPAESQIAKAMREVSEASYDARKDEYESVRDHVEKAALATLHILGSSGHPNALILIKRLAGGAAVAYFASGGVSDEPDEEEEEALLERARRLVGARLRAAFENPDPIEDEKVRALLRDARKAAEKLKRNGFRPEQWASDGAGEIRTAHAEAAAELVRLLEELDRLAKHFGRQFAVGALTRAAGEDRDAFSRVFRHFYLGGRVG